MSRSVEWEGFLPAVVTPFKPGGAIDEAGFVANIETFIEEGVGGIVVCGHNGEAWALTAQERTDMVKLARKTIDQGPRKVPLIAGVEAISSHELITESNQHGAAGADGLLVTPPFYVTTATDDEIIDRYAALARKTDVPIMAYNNPRRTSINLTPEIIASLADIDGIVAVKQSIRDWNQQSETVRLAGHKIRVFCGPAAYIMPTVLLGAKGYVSTGPDLLGPEGSAYYDMIRRGEMDKVVEIHYKLSNVYAMITKYGTWPSSLKAALEVVGKVGGLPRDPVQPLTPAARDSVHKIMTDLGLVPSGAKA